MPPIATEFAWTNGRGQAMLGVEYLPHGPAQGALLWHHGVCEHSGRYGPVFEHIAGLGVAVYTFDAHGHGRSQPEAPSDRCLVTRFDDLVRSSQGPGAETGAGARQRRAACPPRSGCGHRLLLWELHGAPRPAAAAAGGLRCPRPMGAPHAYGCLPAAAQGPCQGACPPLPRPALCLPTLSRWTTRTLSYPRWSSGGARGWSPAC